MVDADEETSSRLISTEAGSIHYHDLGVGKPLIMLQAFGPVPGTTAWLTYRRVVRAFARRYRCVLLDYPNFGRSSPIVFDEPVHDLYTRQAFMVMDALEIDSAPLVGVSTGGTVALDMALSAPDRVDQLVIGSCEASTGGDPFILAPAPSEVLRLFEECNEGEPEPAKLRRLLLAIVHDPALVTDVMVEEMYRWRVEEPEHAASWSASVSHPHGNMTAIRELDMPTLIIHGRHDRMVPLEQALRLLSNLPKADLVVLNECGHWPPVERPDDFSRHALSFLRAH